MIKPSPLSYVRALRRFWYVPLLSILASAALGLLNPILAPSYVTIGDVTFTIAAGDPGQESDGTARLSEQELGKQLLSAYSYRALLGNETQALLQDAGVRVPPSAASSPIGEAGQTKLVQGPLTITVGEGGVVTVRLDNEVLSAPDARRLVSAIQEVFASQFILLDRSQERPISRQEA